MTGERPQRPTLTDKVSAMPLMFRISCHKIIGQVAVFGYPRGAYMSPCWDGMVIKMWGFHNVKSAKCIALSASGPAARP